MVLTNQLGALSPLTIPTEYILNSPFNEFSPSPHVLSQIFPCDIKEL